MFITNDRNFNAHIGRIILIRAQTWNQNKLESISQRIKKKRPVSLCGLSSESRETTIWKAIFLEIFYNRRDPPRM